MPPENSTSAKKQTGAEKDVDTRVEQASFLPIMWSVGIISPLLAS